MSNGIILDVIFKKDCGRYLKYSLISQLTVQEAKSYSHNCNNNKMPDNLTDQGVRSYGSFQDEGNGSQDEVKLIESTEERNKKKQHRIVAAVALSFVIGLIILIIVMYVIGIQEVF